MDIISARVRSLREYKGWSQEDLANASGLQRPHISLIETKERVPGADTLVKLATALQTSVDYLLGLSDSPAPPPPINDPAYKDPHFVYFSRMWPLLPDYAHDIFVRQVKGMELYNDDLRQAMADAGLDVPPRPPKE